MDSEEAKDEEDRSTSLVTWISNLEKTHGDILTLLGFLNNHFNVSPESPLESVCKHVQFSTYETVEPHTLQAVAQVEKSADLP